MAETLENQQVNQPCTETQSPWDILDYSSHQKLSRMNHEKYDENFEKIILFLP